MKKAKVLVVDDAMLIRRLVTEVIAADPSIEVVGEAPNGRIALQKIAQLAPDLVTLDVEMPEMNGLQTLKEIRKTHPRLPVIMFSAVTERGAAYTLEALHSGASDYVTKPATGGGKASAQQRIQQELLPKIKSLCRLGAAAPGGVKRDPGAAASPAPLALRPLGAVIPADVVAVSLSTGGPAAFAEILTHLSGTFPAPMLVVPHMAAMFTKFFAERLNGQTGREVVEAADGQALAPGVVYVAPGNFHLRVRRAAGHVSIALDQEPPDHSHRPSADALFQSVAEVYGPRALGLVLTGMGQDGVRGSEALTRAGGRVVVQDEATSVVWEAAGLVAAGGFADAVVPLARLANELERRTARASGVAAGPAALPAGARSGR
jgi:two-component system, chemotaxis family, protein-glutamate methylesterase/glutaminase